MAARSSILVAFMVLFSNLLVVIESAVKCSPINVYSKLSKKEDFCFELPTSSASESEVEQLDVRFLGVESHYHVPQMYTFFPPNVSLHCECSCDSPPGGSCGTKTNYKHDKCARHKSDNSVCTLLYSDGIDTNVCPIAYRMCCQVYFSNPGLEGTKYHGLYLNKHENKMQMSIAINISKDGKVRKSQVYHIPNHVRNIQVDNDSRISLAMVSPNEALPDDWYYVQDDSKTLMTGLQINKIGEQDFRKLGWFQMGRFGPDEREELLTFDTHLLQRSITLHPRTCGSGTPQFEWDFLAKYFNKQGGAWSPVVGRIATQVHGRYVSDINVDLAKKSVIVDHRNPPELTLIVTKIEPLLEQFAFNASIHLDKDSFYILKVTFITGTKITYVINVGNDQEGSEDYYATIYKSQNFPVRYSFRLVDKSLQFPTWVCIYEDGTTQKQLCRFVQLSQEKYKEPPPEVKAANLQLVKDEYDHGHLMSLIILTLCMTIISIIINGVIIFVFCRRRRRKATGMLRSTNSFEKIKKDLKKDERAEPDNNRYSHVYEYLHPTSNAKPHPNTTESHAV